MCRKDGRRRRRNELNYRRRRMEEMDEWRMDKKKVNE